MAKKGKILIVDDDREYVHKINSKLSGLYDLSIAYSENEFWKNFSPNVFDLLIIDIRLDERKKGNEGLNILKKVKELDPEQEAIILTMYEEREFMMSALSMGATLFLSKRDFTPSTVAKMVNMAIEKRKLKKKVNILKREIETLEPFDIVGESKIIKKIKREIEKAALDGEITVLITGESGTGKELVARNIHRFGVRKDGPFIAVSISGLNKETIYSELFGYEKGAFTGAIGRKRGFFEEADGGVLFLDEIGDLSGDLQVKLLRVIENKNFTRLGSTKETQVDVQFITATNRNLDKLVSEELFRKDLFYRLKAFEIYVPPLRERKEDIPLLVNHFLKLLHLNGRTTATAVSHDVMKFLQKYDWPGNVRQLRNVIEYAGIQARADRDSVIKISHLPSDIIKKNDLKLKTEVEDYRLFLAQAELSLIKNALREKNIKKKSELARVLRYPNRFTFLRRVKRIFNDYPHLRKLFPEISKMFPEEGRD